METINWHSFFFLLFAAIAAAMAVAVVVSANIVRMAFYLVLSLGAVAGLFFLAGADFLGGVQLMVYVGGTLVLLVFGVMLTARGPLGSLQTGGGQWVMAVIVGAALLMVLLQTAFSVEGFLPPREPMPMLAKSVPAVPPTSELSVNQLARHDGLGLGLLGIRVEKLADESQEDNVREGMAGYLLPFEIVSVHLFVVLIGAAFLARAKRRNVRLTAYRPPRTTDH